MKSISFVFAFIVINNLSAQQSLNTGGGNTSNSSGSVSFSIGQLVFNTQIATGGSVRQGVQQAFEILNVSGIDQIKLTYNINIYPIPANDFLTLNLGNCELKNTKYQIFDMNGKMIDEKVIQNSIENIGISSFTTAFYFIKIISDNIEIKTFKIIKN